MGFRAKLIVDSILRTRQQPSAVNVVFRPVASNDRSLPGNQFFHKDTPSGRVELYIDNSAVVEQLEVGKEFYVDFSPVPSASVPAEPEEAPISEEAEPVVEKVAPPVCVAGVGEEQRFSERRLRSGEWRGDTPSNWVKQPDGTFLPKEECGCSPG